MPTFYNLLTICNKASKRKKHLNWQNPILRDTYTEYYNLNGADVVRYKMQLFMYYPDQKYDAQIHLLE